MKARICEYISTETLIETTNYFKSPIKKYEEIDTILKSFKENKGKFLYFNKNDIHKLLYDSEGTITINNNIVKNKISDYFYLLLLIEDNPSLINYVYSIDFIQNINNQLENEGNNLKSILLSKVITELIDNYKNTDIYNEIEDDEELNKIKNNKNLYNNNVKELNELKINLDFIKGKNLDEIYTKIIIELINSINNYEFVSKLIDELDLKNINITQKIYNKLSETLNKVQKYKIKYTDDFKFTEEIINFYYVLFMYILKSPIYIYNIDLLLESRKNFLFIIKNKSKESIIINLKNCKEKFEYIFKFMTDTKYYNDILTNKFIFPNTLKREDKSTNNNSLNKNLSTSAISNFPFNQKSSEMNNQIQKHKDNDTSKNTNNENCEIIQFEKIINKKDKTSNDESRYQSKKNNKLNDNNIQNTYNKKYYSQFIKKIKDDCLMIGDDNGILYTYNKNFEMKKEKNAKYYTEFDLIKNKLKEEKKEEKIEIREIGEITEETKIGLILTIKEMNEEEIEKLVDGQISRKKIINYNYVIYFETQINSNKKYIIAFEKGIFQFDFSPFGIYLINDFNKYKTSDISFKCGTKINDNYLALSSNSILSNGKDKLFIYDIKNKTIIQELDGSFYCGINCLNILDIDCLDIGNKKILLCACKKYISGQKNGIMVIDTEIKKNEQLKYKFYPFDNFEVNCFCQIEISKEDKMIKTNYFFVGGFDEDKREGIIKLYEIKYKDEKNFDIIFLEDIEIEIKDKLCEFFNGSINCIIQNNNGKLLVSCLDGNIYAFSRPDISSSFGEEEEDIDSI